MTHLSEQSTPLQIREIEVYNLAELQKATRSHPDVCLLRLPGKSLSRREGALNSIGDVVADIAANLGPNAILISLGEMIDLAHIQAAMGTSARYQLLISIKTLVPRIPSDLCSLPGHHWGALVHTRYRTSLEHTNTRIQYTYCPVCNKTTKDYGGKKHTYHEYGTLLSDVWRDIAIMPDGDISPILQRFADLFGVQEHGELLVVDCRRLGLERVAIMPSLPQVEAIQPVNVIEASDRLINGDCLEKLGKLPNNSIDFVFADPPYNLGKSYSGYSDDLAITKYFEWCDEWLTEIARVLRPGRTCAILNIPLWAIRHFLHLETVLIPQNWITWDALSYPVRRIMPANYTILCFSKGRPRVLPGLSGAAGKVTVSTAPLAFGSLRPLAENFCLRASCVQKRRRSKINDRAMLTDLWWDIHRLKHNSRRVDHPTQLPPQLMYRLISLFTKEGEVVLDCFNGSGTTTLAAHQLNRHYIGIELDQKYHEMALARHLEITEGIDPFRKTERILTAKNSRVPRMPKRKYEVSKKRLQLEVKRIAQELGRLPTRDDVFLYGRYPIRYYDEYFASWGEVCAAARTTGMTEYKKSMRKNMDKAATQLPFDFETRSRD